MDVKCEKCGTEYEFDDRKVTESGITVKCTNCGHLFRVVRQPVRFEQSSGGDPHDPSQETPRPQRANWMIRDAAGEVREFKDLATLQQWIAQGKVAPTDQISKSGETWKPLGTIVELSSMFRVPPGAAQARNQPPPPPVGPGMLASGEFRLDTPGRVVTPQPMQGPGVGRASLSFGTAPPGPVAPAGAYNSGAMPAMHLSQPINTMNGYVPGPMTSQQFQVHPGSYGDASQSSSPLVFQPDPAMLAVRQEPGGAARGFAMGVLATIALAGVAYFVHDQFSQPQIVEPAPMVEQGNEAVSGALAALERAKTASHRDSDEGRQATRQAARDALDTLGAPPSNATYAAQAKALIASSLIIDAEYAALEGRKSELLGAERLLTEARALSAANADVLLATGDLHRVAGRKIRALERISEARRLGADVHALQLLESALELHTGGAAAPTAERMARLSPEQLELPRAHYLQAVAFKRAGRKKDAHDALKQLLAAHPDHRPGQRLLRSLNAEKVIAQPTAPASVASAPPTAAAPKVVAAAKPAAAKRATKAASGSFDSLLRRGGTALEKGQTAAARRYLKAALKKNPRSPEGWANLGWCDLDEGRTAAAISNFRKALSRSGRYADAMYGLGSALERAGRKPEAVEAYRRYLDAHPRGRHARMIQRKLDSL
jgi:predicted Zn finger-like uncharacterized protein